MTIKCNKCRYLRIDTKSSTKTWTAHECGNRGSLYYKSLLNMTMEGTQLKGIVCPGCKDGKVAG